MHQLLFPPLPGTNQRGSFKTWEYDPRYAIRSWGFLLQFVPLKWLSSAIGSNKVRTTTRSRSSLVRMHADRRNGSLHR